MTTLTRAHLAQKIFTEVGLSQNECADLVDMVLDQMVSALEAGEPLKISGFATFAIRQKGQRIGRNPKTKVEALISARRVVVFRPSQELKAHVNHTAPGCLEGPGIDLR